MTNDNHLLMKEKIDSAIADEKGARAQLWAAIRRRGSFKESSVIASFRNYLEKEMYKHSHVMCIIAHEIGIDEDVKMFIENGKYYTPSKYRLAQIYFIKGNNIEYIKTLSDAANRGHILAKRDILYNALRENEISRMTFVMERAKLLISGFLRSFSSPGHPTTVRDF
ncbi:hypothetical protein [Oricola cellulosilytica]|uniref:Uncharacterized protein n=1 Tax=Oricola cellulosilytica TaxID=1429082 RepID=A0A4R0PFN6_9HYPH|nr:hypothetical protein [Oricola cellulosilytica]TCD16657.1 hypothetical protein E0D97_04395 [Oricola cellulosilytica]